MAYVNNVPTMYIYTKSLQIKCNKKKKTEKVQNESMILTDQPHQ